MKENRLFVSTQAGGTGFNPGLKFRGKNDQRTFRKNKLCIFKISFSVLLWNSGTFFLEKWSKLQKFHILRGSRFVPTHPLPFLSICTRRLYVLKCDPGLFPLSQNFVISIPTHLTKSVVFIPEWPQGIVCFTWHTLLPIWSMHVR